MAAGLVLTAAGGQAAPREQTRTQAPPDHLPGDRHDTKSTDNRKGRVLAGDRQRDRAAALGARVRWTDFGTPATLTSTGKPSPPGCPPTRPPPRAVRRSQPGRAGPDRRGCRRAGAADGGADGAGCDGTAPAALRRSAGRRRRHAVHRRTRRSGVARQLLAGP
ncbi:hypothetical protein V2I01_34950 [Micromonospora sp. BRA006-A]|nr:hypothetical protein [Micromonospora sp. BRA006-A]